MIVTYRDLLDGYILKEKDTLCNIHGFRNYIVSHICLNKFLYSNGSDSNDTIYRKLGINKPEGNNKTTMNDLRFPEFDTLEELTKEVVRLYETPEYKIGDHVRIKIFQNDNSYPFGVTEEMLKYESLETIITGVSIDNPVNRDEEFMNGDYHGYKLSIDSGKFTWHSSMFGHTIQAPVSAVKKNELIIINNSTYQVVNGISGWFLTCTLINGCQSSIVTLFEQAQIEDPRKFFTKNGIHVTEDGLFPFVATAEDLAKAIDLLSKRCEKVKEESVCVHKKESITLKEPYSSSGENTQKILKETIKLTLPKTETINIIL